MTKSLKCFIILNNIFAVKFVCIKDINTHDPSIENSEPYMIDEIGNILVPINNEDIDKINNDDVDEINNVNVEECVKTFKKSLRYLTKYNMTDSYKFQRQAFESYFNTEINENVINIYDDEYELDCFSDTYLKSPHLLIEKLLCTLKGLGLLYEQAPDKFFYINIILDQLKIIHKIMNKYCQEMQGYFKS